MRDARRRAPVRCVVPGCLADTEFMFLGGTDAGWVRLTDLAGNRVRSCQPHLPEVLEKLTRYPGAPQVVRAVPAYSPATHDTSHGSTSAERPRLTTSPERPRKNRRR